ncbi:TadE/TadG family type IV pilus assembly protein [Arthrobacter sp. C9C5]|uniref:TadE/TadG family type IV pilus assembly protein n=1 Tax=Arthrobacter sp. C9C5 TaxID=2735267 RepID=UPI0015846C3E|nr:TadE/TadG family type IV pilus assembly protein [Arthrobacter sp. C9C5]NUU30390.1 pilus assembly protein [Arthrobacter sp. C9C5]
MRRVAFSGDTERGGIAVMVALLMVVLLGFAAISIDVARLYSERGQLQNGADSVALMLGQKCAKNLNDVDCSDTLASPVVLARTLANANAVDGQSNVKAIVLDKANRKATVTTSAKASGGALNSVPDLFARALGFSNSEVTATSNVQWGTPSKGTVIVPLAIAECKFSPDPSFVQVLNMNAGGCSGIPGGFGWITDPNGADSACSVVISAGASNNPGIWFSSDTGASRPSVCSPGDISALNDQTVLLPLYAVATGTGSGGKYYIKGFAAFHVTGYRFSSDTWNSSGLANKSLRGYFVKFVSLSQALELGSTADYGASVVRLTIGVP